VETFGDNYKILVYTKDFTDSKEMNDIACKMANMKILYKIYYRPDIYEAIGLVKNNIFGLSYYIKKLHLNKDFL